MARAADWTLSFALVSLVTAAACAPHPSGDEDELVAETRSHDDECRTIPDAPAYADWPRIRSRIRKDDDQERFIGRVVAAMTLEQKVGQMTQLELRALRNATTGIYNFAPITELALGSILTGGSSKPNENKHASLNDWLAVTDAVWQASPVVTVPTHRGKTIEVRIPTFWGIDAVHGNQAVFGATIFPHNIGLGATRNTCLARKIGAATTRAVRASGIDMAFGPTVAAVRDDRWGRTYEGFSEDPSVVRALGTAGHEGTMFGDRGDGDGPHRRRTSFPGVITNAKHYIADGGSSRGIDQGIVPAPESELINIHGQGYFGALEAGAQVVMVGFFSWQDRGQDRGEMVADEYLVNQVLKQKIGFDGMVLSDFNAIAAVTGCTVDHCPQAVNAGVDMFMVPFDFRNFVKNTIADVQAGRIPMARIDDAVTRILRVKVRAGLFELPRPSERRFAGDEDAITDRALARRAVRESLVLLKNNDRVLPLRRDQKILVVGKSADSIQNQTGGWSLTFQGGPSPTAPNAVNLNSDFPAGQSILAGIRETAGAANVTFSVDAAGVDVGDFDAVIAVIGEFPYAEVLGDIATATGNWRDPNNLAKRTLEHGVRYPEDRAVLQAVSGHGVPVVTVLVSGRALYINTELNLSAALVAAWLPGTEGAGIADVLFRDRHDRVNHDFVGTLPYSWPRSACQTTVNVGDADYNPQFAFGYGLNYRSSKQVGALDDSAGPSGGCPN